MLRRKRRSWDLRGEESSEPQEQEQTKRLRLKSTKVARCSIPLERPKTHIVRTSLARPVRPMKRRSCILKTLGKSQLTVMPWTPNRLSLHDTRREDGEKRMKKREGSHETRCSLNRRTARLLALCSFPIPALTSPCDGDAVLAGHGDDGAAVVGHDVLQGQTKRTGRR